MRTPTNPPTTLGSILSVIECKTNVTKTLKFANLCNLNWNLLYKVKLSESINFTVRDIFVWLQRLRLILPVRLMVTSPRSISTVTGVVSLASVSLFLFLLVWSPVLFSLFLLLLCCSPGVVELKSGHLPYSLIEFFSKCTRMTIMPTLEAEALLSENKKIQWKMLPPVGIEPWLLITSDSKSSTILSGLSWHLLVRLRL